MRLAIDANRIESWSRRCFKGGHAGDSRWLSRRDNIPSDTRRNEGPLIYL
jgi:hypothetical protein